MFREIVLGRVGERPKFVTEGGGGVSHFRGRGGILGDRVAHSDNSDCFLYPVSDRICSRLFFSTWARNPLSTLL